MHTFLILSGLLWTGSPPGAQRVEVNVQILEASNDPGAGPASRAARDLGATLNYKSFRTLSQETRTLSLGEQVALALANGGTLNLSPKTIDPKAHTIRLQVSVLEGKHHLDTDYTVRDGGTVFVSAGPIGKDVLVLAIVPKAK